MINFMGSTYPMNKIYQRNNKTPPILGLRSPVVFKTKSAEVPLLL